MNLFYCTLFLFTEFKRIFFGNISKNGLGINSSDLLRFWKLVVLQLKVHKYNVSPDYFTLILYLSAKLCEVKSSNMCKHSFFLQKHWKTGGYEGFLKWKHSVFTSSESTEILRRLYFISNPIYSPLKSAKRC